MMRIIIVVVVVADIVVAVVTAGVIIVVVGCRSSGGSGTIRNNEVHAQVGRVGEADFFCRVGWAKAEENIQCAVVAMNGPLGEALAGVTVTGHLSGRSLVT